MGSGSRSTDRAPWAGRAATRVVGAGVDVLWGCVDVGPCLGGGLGLLGDWTMMSRKDYR